MIEVPYDCGRFGERMGSGPLELTATLPPPLASAGHEVEVRPVRLPERFFHEVAAVVALQHEVRREARIVGIVEEFVHVRFPAYGSEGTVRV